MGRVPVGITTYVPTTTGTITGPTGSSLSVWFSVRSFVCSFVCSFVRVPERSIWSSEFVFYTNKMLRNFEFESHQAQSVIYPFRSMRSVCVPFRSKCHRSFEFELQLAWIHLRSMLFVPFR
jgi:hypothetical protein